MNPPTVVFHWWAEEGDSAPIHNMRSPIVPAMYVLRHYHPNVRIMVLDCSDKPQDWGNLCSDLDLGIKRIEPSLARYSDKKGWKHLSRLLDISKHVEADAIIYQDSDVFWLERMGLIGNWGRFSFNANNSGFFYYHRAWVEEFFQTFEAFAITGLHDEAFRLILRQHLDSPEWYYLSDEAILTYMYNRHNKFFHKIWEREHGLVRNIEKKPDQHFYMLHLNGTMVANHLTPNPVQRKHCRGLATLLIEEFYVGIEKVVDRMFTDEEIRFYEQRVSLRDPEFLKLLFETKDETGHYHLTEAWQKKTSGGGDPPDVSNC